MPNKTPDTVITFPKQTKQKSSHEKIWGKAIISHGYTAVPSILIRSQKRLGLSPLQMNLILQLLDYWFEPSRYPFPTKKQLAERMNVTPKTIQNNMKLLEGAGLIERVQRKTAAGDWGSNIYKLDKLVDKIKTLEPDYTKQRKLKKLSAEILETPVGVRRMSQK